MEESEKKRYLELLKSRSVLYLEDDMVTRNAFMEILKNYFKDVFVATNGKDGYEKYCDLLPDFIITDVEMPIMGAIEFIRKVRERSLHVPIMTVSAFEDSEHISDEATIVLHKPLRSERIKNSLAHLSSKLKEHQKS